MLAKLVCMSLCNQNIPIHYGGGGGGISDNDMLSIHSSTAVGKIPSGVVFLLNCSPFFISLWHHCATHSVGRLTAIFVCDVCLALLICDSKNYDEP